MIGAMGLGAVVGSTVLKSLRQRFAPRHVVGAAVTIYALTTLVLSRVACTVFGLAIARLPMPASFLGLPVSIPPPAPVGDASVVPCTMQEPRHESR